MMEELGKRVVTGTVLAAIVSGVIAFGDPIWVTGLAGLTASGAMAEWTRLSKNPPSPTGSALWGVLALVLTITIAALYRHYPMAVSVVALAWVSLLAWVAWVSVKGSGYSLNPSPGMGLVIVCPALACIPFVHQYFPDGILFLFALCLLVWGSDIGAYAVGRKWGQHKLAPSVSPGKTWEGVIGGVVIGTAGTTALIGWGIVPSRLTLAVLIGIAFCSVVSVLGDLFESMVKRVSGKKDSGSFLPGHGGILDRIDSLLAAAPVFSALLLLVYSV